MFSRTKTFIQVWNYLRVSKWWQNFHFWVHCPFKSFFSSGEDEPNMKKCVAYMRDSELIRCYTLDRAGIMFVTDLIRDALTSPTPRRNGRNHYINIFGNWKKCNYAAAMIWICHNLLLIVFSHVTGSKTWRAKHPQNCSTSMSIFHVSQPQIFRSPLKRIKQRYFWTKCKFWPFAIHIKHPWQYFNHKQCDKNVVKKCLNIFKTVILKDQIQYHHINDA